MKKLLMFIVSASLIFMISGSAWASSIKFDFESETATFTPPPGPSPGALASLTMTENGLTATLSRTTAATEFDIINTSGFPGSFPATWGLQHLDPFSASPAGDSFLADFSIPLNTLSIEFGDFAGDDDSLVELSAFSGLGGTGTLLDTNTSMWLISDSLPSLFKTLTVSSSTPFSSVLFTSGGDFPNSLYWDNMEVEPIPEPATIALFGMGMVGLVGAGARRKFKKEKKAIIST